MSKHGWKCRLRRSMNAISCCAVNFTLEAACFLHLPAQPGHMSGLPPSVDELCSSASSYLDDAVRLKCSSKDYMEVWETCEMGDSDRKTTYRSVLDLAACQLEAKAVGGKQLRKRPVLMTKLFQLRKLNFSQLGLKLMCFSLMRLEVLPNLLGPAPAAWVTYLACLSLTFWLPLDCFAGIWGVVEWSGGLILC